jgi:general secretion pathway protein I
MMPSPANRSRSTRRATAGFSLLEVLVAFVILALVVTALFRLYGGAMSNASAADDWTRALLVAQSRLELAAAIDPMRERTDSGSEDGGRITWTSTVAAWVPPDADPDLVQASQTMPTRLYRISVVVTFPGAGDHTRSVSLSTVMIGARNPA